jgi:hypothetical protein
MPLNTQLTSDYMRGFLGYGNPNGRWWFVGREEGGGQTWEEVQARIQYWNQNRPYHFDAVDFHRAVGHGLEQWFPTDKLPRLQSTWNKLIGIMLAANGIIDSDTPNAERIEFTRKFQAQYWGRNESDTFLTEILPLPSPTESPWHYSRPDWWDNNAPPQFALNRKEAFAHSETQRLLILESLWEVSRGKNKEKIVVYYAGGSDRHDDQYWNWLTQTLGFGENLPLVNDQPNLINETIIVRIPHVQAWGRTTADWINIGQQIAKLRNGQHG